MPCERHMRTDYESINACAPKSCSAVAKGSFEDRSATRDVRAGRRQLMHKYEIILYRSNGGHAFIAEAPELPACLAHGGR